MGGKSPVNIEALGLTRNLLNVSKPNEKNSYVYFISNSTKTAEPTVEGLEHGVANVRRLRVKPAMTEAFNP